MITRRRLLQLLGIAAASAPALPAIASALAKTHPYPSTRRVPGFHRGGLIEQHYHMRRGGGAEAIIPLGQLRFDNREQRIYVGDGKTPGGLIVGPHFELPIDGSPLTRA